MKSKKLIVIEDSSKSSFGGGQQVTLIVSDWWNREFGQVLVVDHINPFIPPSAFSAKCLSNRLSYLPILYSFFKISSTPKSSYSLTLIEYIFYPLLIPFNSLLIFFLVVKTYFFENSEVTVYCPAKKSLLESFLVSPIVPIVYHSHNVTRKSILSSIFQVYASFICKKTISVSSASALVSNTKNYTLPNPFNQKISQSQFKSYLMDKVCKLKSDKIMYFDCFSNFLAWKGHTYLLSAIRLFYDNNPEMKNSVRFRLFGDGVLLSNIKTEIVSLNLEDYVFTPGRINNVCLTLLTQSYFTVLPSIDQEACPMSLIESLSCGVPLITSNIGGQSQFSIPDFSYSPKNVFQLSQLLAKAASMPVSEYTSMSQKLIINSERFNLSSYYKALSVAFA